MVKLVYDTPESIKELEEFTYNQIKNGESNKRIIELAKYKYYMSMTAAKIEEVINIILKEQGRKHNVPKELIEMTVKLYTCNSGLELMEEGMTFGAWGKEYYDKADQDNVIIVDSKGVTMKENGAYIVDPKFVLKDK